MNNYVLNLRKGNITKDVIESMITYGDNMLDNELYKGVIDIGKILKHGTYELSSFNFLYNAGIDKVFSKELSSIYPNSMSYEWYINLVDLLSMCLREYFGVWVKKSPTYYQIYHSGENITPLIDRSDINTKEVFKETISLIRKELEIINSNHYFLSKDYSSVTLSGGLRLPLCVHVDYLFLTITFCYIKLF